MYMYMQCFGSGSGRIRIIVSEKMKKKIIGICSILGRIRIHHPGSGSADPDPHKNDTDPKHCVYMYMYYVGKLGPTYIVQIYAKVHQSFNKILKNKNISRCSVLSSRK